MQGTHLNKVVGIWGPGEHDGPGLCGRHSVQVEWGPSTGIGIGPKPGGVGHTALVEGPGGPGQGAVTRRQANLQGAAWQRLAGWDGVLVQAVGCQTRSHRALASLWKSCKLTQDSILGGLSRAGVTSLPDGRGRLCLPGQAAPMQEWQGVDAGRVGGRGAQAGKRLRTTATEGAGGLMPHSRPPSMPPAAYVVGARASPVL